MNRYTKAPTATDYSKRDNVLGFIRDFINANGFPPTLREIGRELGYKSTSSVRHQIDTLEADGLLTRINFASRAIRLTAKGREYINVNR